MVVNITYNLHIIIELMPSHTSRNVLLLKVACTGSVIKRVTLVSMGRLHQPNLNLSTTYIRR